MDSAVLGLRVLLALACVIGLIWVLARRAGWGKGRRRPAGPAVEVVGRHAFGRHAGVAVVAVGDRRLLLGYGEQNVTMLTELDPAPADETEGDEPDAPAVPMTLGALAAAVLPTPRRTRAAAEPSVVAVAAPGFEAALAAASADAASADAASGPVPGLAGPEAARVDAGERVTALHGSVLAPSTWKQAVAALRERTVRR